MIASLALSVITSRIQILLVLLIGVVYVSTAQVPVTELYMFQLTQDATQNWHAHSPVYLSDFNPDGYTNQPEFITNDQLYVSVRRPNMLQNDIFSLNTKSGEIEQVTKTAESEFSPTKMPEGKSFSCVRQVHSDEMDQQLYAYPLDRSLNGETVFPDIKNIGYHCWLNEDALGLFLVDDPSRLATANVDAGTHTILASKIGRSLHRTPDGKLAYVHKYTDEFWYLKTMNLMTGDTEIVTETLKDCEDFVINADGYYFMGQGSTLFVLDPSDGDDKAWKQVADLGIFGVKKITRLAINERGEIAVVSLTETN